MRIERRLHGAAIEGRSKFKYCTFGAHGQVPLSELVAWCGRRWQGPGSGHSGAYGIRVQFRPSPMVPILLESLHVSESPHCELAVLVCCSAPLLRACSSQTPSLSPAQHALLAPLSLHQPSLFFAQSSRGCAAFVLGFLHLLPRVVGFL